MILIGLQLFFDKKHQTKIYFVPLSLQATKKHTRNDLPTQKIS